MSIAYGSPRYSLRSAVTTHHRLPLCTLLNCKVVVKYKSSTLFRNRHGARVAVVAAALGDDDDGTAAASMAPPQTPQPSPLLDRAAALAVTVAGPVALAVAAAAVAAGTLAPATALFALALAAAAITIVRAALEARMLAASGSGSAQAQNLLAAVRGRRSVYAKDFTGAPVTRAQLETMLEAARWAPTHKRTEPWRFVVLAGEAKSEFESLTQRLVAERAPEDKREAVLAKLARKAGADWKLVSCYVAICVKRSPDKLPEWEEVAATACAAQNMWLAAGAAGVAGYWSSWQEAARTAPEMLEFLGMAPGDLCLGFFVAGVGDPERAAAYKGARQPLDACVEWRGVARKVVD